MSFKCSVFGHAFGDAEIEREREEEGKEVVTTIREKQTCKRCGETRVVSENKEVTTLETAADIVAEDLDDDEDDGADVADGPATPEEEAVIDESATDAEIIDEAEDAEVVEDAEDEGDDDADEAVEVDDPAVVEDDAEVIGDDADGIEETETGDDEVEEDAETAIPDAETGDDVADTPDASSDDGVILEDEAEQAPAGDRALGEWPDEPEESEDDWEPETEPDFEEGTTIEQTSTAVTVPEGEFQCPECEFTRPVAESSLREGDFCPDCHRGSLEHVSE